MKLKRCVSRVRKRKKLSVVQLFTFTQAVHRSLLILFKYVKPAKFDVCTHVKFTRQLVEIHLQIDQGNPNYRVEMKQPGRVEKISCAKKIEKPYFQP